MSEPYEHVRRTEHQITVTAERITTGVLHHLAVELLNECGNDADVFVTVRGAAGPRDDQEIMFEVTS